MKEIDFSTLATQWSIFPDRRSYKFYCNGYHCPRTIVLYASTLGEDRGIFFLVVLRKFISNIANYNV